MKIGLSADHGGFELKEKLHSYLLSMGHDIKDFGAYPGNHRCYLIHRRQNLLSMGHDIKDFGAYELNNTDDFPDFVIPMARAVANLEVERGIAVCGSGVGASVAANKVAGARAALIMDHFSAHQGVEDDDLNILCLGGRVVGIMLAQELIRSFLNARFKGEERHLRRMEKVNELEK